MQILKLSNSVILVEIIVNTPKSSGFSVLFCNHRHGVCSGVRLELLTYSLNLSPYIGGMARLIEVTSVF